MIFWTFLLGEKMEENTKVSETKPKKKLIKS